MLECWSMKTKILWIPKKKGLSSSHDGTKDSNCWASLRGRVHGQIRRTSHGLLTPVSFLVQGKIFSGTKPWFAPFTAVPFNDTGNRGGRRCPHTGDTQKASDREHTPTTQPPGWAQIHCGCASACEHSWGRKGYTQPLVLFTPSVQGVTLPLSSTCNDAVLPGISSTDQLFPSKPRPLHVQHGQGRELQPGRGRIHRSPLGSSHSPVY